MYCDRSRASEIPREFRVNPVRRNHFQLISARCFDDFD
jgi:hypothetical protein